MYNEPRKNVYLNTLTKERVIKDSISAFNAIESGENNIGTDVADANLEQLKIILMTLNTPSHYSRHNKLSLIERYVEFEIKNQFTLNSSNYVTFYKKNANNELNNMSVIYETYFKDPAEAFGSFQQYFGDATVDAQYISYIAYLCLLYCGFTSKEALQLQEKDIDYDNHLICGKYIYKEMWDAIISSLKTTIKIGRGHREYDVPEYLQDYIIKNDMSNFVRFFAHDLSVRKPIVREENVVFVSFTTKSVQKSGKWYSMYWKEKNHIPLEINSRDRKDYENYKRAFWE